jgi:hypothetical protein
MAAKIQKIFYNATATTATKGRKTPKTATVWNKKRNFAVAFGSNNWPDAYLKNHH